MPWFVKQGGKPRGPLDAAQLKALAANGIVGPDTEVAQSEAGPWVAAKKVRGLFDAPVPVAPAPVSSAPPPDKQAEKACPFCGESILAVAIKCKHCGEMLGQQGSYTSSGKHVPIAMPTAPARYDADTDLFIGSSLQLIQIAIQAVQELGWTLGTVNETLGVVNFETGVSWGSWSGVTCTLTIQPVSAGQYRVTATGKQNVRGAALFSLNIGNEARKRATKAIYKMRELVGCPISIRPAGPVLADQVGGCLFMALGVWGMVGTIPMLISQGIAQAFGLGALGLCCTTIGFKTYTVGFVPWLKRLSWRGLGATVLAITLVYTLLPIFVNIFIFQPIQRRSARLVIDEMSEDNPRRASAVPPLIVMPDEIGLPSDLVDGDTLHQVRTVRQGDPITFAMRAIEDLLDGQPLLMIDTATGDIKVPSVAKLRQLGESIEISVTATDTAGLSDEKTVTINLQP